MGNKLSAECGLWKQYCGHFGSNEGEGGSDQLKHLYISIEWQIKTFYEDSDAHCKEIGMHFC